MVRLDFDFDFNDTLQSVLLRLRKHKAKIVAFDPQGPGGGNPNLLLEFANEQDALAFFRQHSPGETEEFMRSRFETV
jgi:hypothetical protein